MSIPDLFRTDKRQMILAGALMGAGYLLKRTGGYRTSKQSDSFSHTTVLHSEPDMCALLYDFEVLEQNTKYEQLVEMVDRFLSFAKENANRSAASQMFKASKSITGLAESLVNDAKRGADMDRVCSCLHAKETALPMLGSALETYVHNRMLD